MTVRIGSLCTGTGALDMAVMDVLGGSMAWHCQYEPPDKNGREDRHQYAARILAHHWPAVPNHGDLTRVDWAGVEPIDVLTAGFPCTDLSYAGLGAGIKEGTRSGLWLTIARAVRTLRPRLVVLENVRAIVNRRPGLDVVLADLAELGFDAEWACVRASDVGAPHPRDRWFCLAWPADADGPGLEGAGPRGATPQRGRAAADAVDLGHQRRREAWDGRPGPADGGLAAADPASNGRHEGRAEPAGIIGRSDAALRGDDVRSCPTCGCAEHYHDAGGYCAGPCGGNCPDAELGRPHGPWNAFDDDADPEQVAQYARRHFAAANAARLGQQDEPRHHAAAKLVAQPGAGDRAGLWNPAEGVDQPGRGAPVVAWGAYEPAIRRWEHILGRPAPRPTEPGRTGERLSPRFVEWMMGLPEGHVCDVPAPGMTPAGLRNARLKALGNGVVPAQAAYALRLLLARASREGVAA